MTATGKLWTCHLSLEFPPICQRPCEDLGILYFLAEIRQMPLHEQLICNEIVRFDLLTDMKMSATYDRLLKLGLVLLLAELQPRPLAHQRSLSARNVSFQDIRSGDKDVPSNRIKGD